MRNLKLREARMKGVLFRFEKKIYSYIHVPQTNFVYGITGNR